MALPAGTRLGPYEILAPLGSGGMGEVYTARDTRLGRDVAVKVLASHLTDAPQARERFRREARAVAALSHPNICTIHDVGETGEGQAFLVMERLHGETLQQRLARGALDTPQLNEVGIALADALAAAHAAGVVHRDIKPANIFLTAHGPKILDFGLARAAVRPASDVSMQATVTRSPTLTQWGSTVGTVAYMSPEQLRGEEVDERTDLFSLGLVLYEAATGVPAFAGATTAIVAAAILHQEPTAPRALRPTIPEPLERIVAKALEKDRALRYQHASEIRADLLRLTRDTDSARPALPRAAAPVAPWRRTAGAIAGGAAVVAAVAAGIYSYGHRPHALTDKDTIVLADFKNTTGDDVFDDTLRRGLAVQLEQSPFLSLMSDDRIRKTLALMGQPKDARLTPAIARDVCERLGSTAVLEGSIAPLGTQYIIGLRASSCRSGDVLAEGQAQAARKEDVLNALGEVAKTFRARVGESLATIEKHSTPLEEATTPSLEALKAYSTAWKVNGTSGTVASIPLFKRALDLDPQFALVLAQLGLSYTGIGEAALAAQSTTRAYELRHRASDRERFFIETLYDRQVTGNLERELQTLTLWAQTYPRDPVAHGLQAGFVSHGTGRYELCLEEARKAIPLDPDLIFPYVSLVSCNLRLERIDDADREWQRAAALHSTFVDIPLIGYELAFLKGNRDGMARQAQAVRAAPGGEERMAHVEALTSAREGRLQLAAGRSLQAIDVAERAGHHEAAATYEAAAAVWSGFFGLAPAARQHAERALQLSRGREPEYAAAVALALAGEIRQAQALAADLDKRYPEDTSVQSTYLPTLRALISLHDGQPALAIEQLQPAHRYEFAQPTIDFVDNFGSLYSTYVRGEAYLALRKPVEAVAEFQKILDHRGLVRMDPMAARARVERARAWAAAGDTGKAQAAYADFLALWKDADPGTPLLDQARAEAAKLP